MNTANSETSQVDARVSKRRSLLDRLCGSGKPSKAFYDEYRGLTIYEDLIFRDYGIQLIRQFYFTSGARYEAARRLKKKNRISVISILVLTFYAMFFSMISTFDKVAEVAHKDLLALLSVFMSSFIAAFSVYEAAKRYDVRSENFLRSSRLIQTLRERLTIEFLSGKATWEKYRDFENEYFLVLDSYSDNHGNIDFMLFRANIGKLDRCKRWRAKAMSKVTVWWLFAFSVASPLMVFFLYYAVINYSGYVIPERKLVKQASATVSNCCNVFDDLRPLGNPPAG